MKPLLENFPVQRAASFVFIILVVLVQLAFLSGPRVGPNPYRRHQFIEAWMASHHDPSTDTKKALDLEIKIEADHELQMTVISIGLFLTIDAALLYAYWRCWIRKTSTP